MNHRKQKKKFFSKRSVFKNLIQWSKMLFTHKWEAKTQEKTFSELLFSNGWGVRHMRDYWRHFCQDKTYATVSACLFSCLGKTSEILKRCDFSFLWNSRYSLHITDSQLILESQCSAALEAALRLRYNFLVLGMTPT